MVIQGTKHIEAQRSPGAWMQGLLPSEEATKCIMCSFQCISECSHIEFSMLVTFYHKNSSELKHYCTRHKKVTSNTTIYRFQT